MNNAEKVKKLQAEAKEHIIKKIIPFWQNLFDRENGGYFGFMDFDLNVDKTAPRSCVLISRILWFFSACYNVLKDMDYLMYANHAYEFLKEKFWDKEYGGLYWMVDYKGNVTNSTKHIYAQAFGIYGLSEFFIATKNDEALQLAKELFFTIEQKSKNDNGFVEEFDRYWNPRDNKHLSEYNVIASKTMNTHLHVLEAYTNLYRTWENQEVHNSLVYLVKLFADTIYDRNTKHFKVICNDNWENIIEAISYGHDIEASWLLDEAAYYILDNELKQKVHKLDLDIAEVILDEAFENGSLINEKVNNKVDKSRIWWVEAETVVGFLNAYQKSNEEKFVEAALSTWEFIKAHLIDKRFGSEWLWKVEDDFSIPKMPIVEPWKCPYHNGRMCLEVIKRSS